MNEDTPRTDKQINGNPCTRFAIMAGDSLRDAMVPSEFARQLERELKAVTEQRDGLRSCIDYASDQLSKVTEQRDGLQKIVDEQCRVSSVCREYRDQRDRLAEALREMQYCYTDKAERMAYEALQSLTTKEQ